MLNVGLSINFDALNHRNQTFLHCGIHWISDPRLLRIFLLNSQFDINTRDDQGCTPLHYLPELIVEAWLGAEDFVEYQMLLDFGADRSLIDDNGRSVANTVRETWGTAIEAKRVRRLLRKYATFQSTSGR